ncbi:MAG: hypothetical protein MI748_08555 [Opitutales bacterium]|nr:hypothetical protein [Opitutales bacterium]
MKLMPLLYKNGFFLLIPIFVWNIILAPHLPEAYQLENFNEGIPRWIALGENIFRGIIFVMPAILLIDPKKLLLFMVGLVLYFMSWLLLILAPETSWSTSVVGFTAPAWLPIIWLAGIGMAGDRYYFKLPFSRWHYWVPSIGFVVFHVAHTSIIFQRWMS